MTSQRGHILNLFLFGNTVKGWLIAIISFSAIFIALFYIKNSISRRLSASSKKTKSDLDDLLVEMNAQTRIWFLFSLSFYLTLSFLQLPEQFRNTIQYLGIA